MKVGFHKFKTMSSAMILEATWVSTNVILSFF
jgi:hypothetical protein